jgi:DNA gyrase subunit A
VARRLTLEDLIADEEMVITISHEGYVKRLPLDTYRAQKRGGRGLQGMDTKEADWVEHLYTAQTHDYLMVFTSRGRCYWIKVHEIPMVGRAARGKPMVNLLALERSERIASIVPVREFSEDRFLIFATKRGVIKRTALSAYRNVRVAGVNAINIMEGDRADRRADHARRRPDRAGDAARHGDPIPRGRRPRDGARGDRRARHPAAQGGRRHRHGGGARGDAAQATLLVVTERGRGKRTAVDDYRYQGRGGKGVLNFRLNEQTGSVVAIKCVFPDDELMLISTQRRGEPPGGGEIRVIGRATQGVRVMSLDDGDALMDVARVVPEDDADDGVADVDAEATALMRWRPPSTAAPMLKSPAGPMRNSTMPATTKSELVARRRSRTRRARSTASRSARRCCRRPGSSGGRPAWCG